MNKLAVISGGTKGIGKAVLYEFARNRFDVATCSRNERALQQVKMDMEKTYLVNMYYKRVDMSSRKEVDCFSNSVLAMERPIDVLVNNVGYFESGKLTDMPRDALYNMMNINLFSAYNLTCGLIEKMKQNKAGHIFLICSVASLAGYPNGGAYTVSKFAMLGLAKVLREELKGFGIRVTAIMPGATLTDSWRGTELPEERFIKPEDVAQSIYGAYLLSRRSVVEELIIRPQLGDV